MNPMTTDIQTQSFWFKIPFIKHYAALARWDRPIGIWLLYWPCVWSMALAPGFGGVMLDTQLKYLGLFFIGAVAMRGAGCVVNDLWDRKLDAQVARTRERPLASGKVSVAGAIIFLILQLLVGAAVLFQLSHTAIIIGLCTLPLIAAYPAMKRITWLPQLFLGAVFNAGALMGWAAMENALSWQPILLYGAAILWTLAYDTVYASLDIKDDALIGVKSTARLWGPDVKSWVGWLLIAFHALFAVVLAATVGMWISYSFCFISFLFALSAHVFWNPLNDGYTLRFFRFQSKIGFLLALAALAPTVF